MKSSLRLIPDLLLKGKVLLLAASLAGMTSAVSGAEAPGATQILKWQDGKKACFMLAFDDGAPSQLEHVVPELEKRKMVGNYYLVTGNRLYGALKRRWETAAKSPYMAVANHTFTHKGAETAEQLDPELAQCNEVLYALHPERKPPYLLGFGKPGGVPWKITNEELDAALTKHHLVNRPPFHGPPINYKSAADVVATVDAVLAKGEMEHLDFHGVGGDWLVTPIEWFMALLDKLEANREHLWITDVVSWHQYVKQREGCTVAVQKADDTTVTVSVTSKLDAKLYDLPITLRTRVPATWKTCTITQGETKTTGSIQDGLVQYRAVPNAGAITLTP